MSERVGERGAPPLALVIAAFVAVYLIWGSTYLAIRFAIETLPPFLMAGVRFVIAGGLVLGVMRLRGVEWPTVSQWRASMVIGGLLLMGGNGGVVWAEQWVPSGPASLIVATVPFWMVLLEAVRPGGTRPAGAVIGGLLVGFVGIALLVGPGEWAGGGIDPIGAAALVLASICWASGSIYARGADLPRSALMATGTQMLMGGGMLILAGSVTGEWVRLDLAIISVRSLAAFTYLILFGSLVGFTAYVWLLKVSTPARVSTYAYVNPVVAVLLGWGLAGEALTGRVVIAVVVILSAVALITMRRHRTGAAGAAAEPAAASGRRSRAA
jgi:drug/metabolite transporter (DMT)-like permease